MVGARWAHHPSARVADPGRGRPRRPLRTAPLARRMHRSPSRDPWPLTTAAPGRPLELFRDPQRRPIQRAGHYQASRAASPLQKYSISPPRGPGRVPVKAAGLQTSAPRAGLVRPYRRSGLRPTSVPSCTSPIETGTGTGSGQCRAHAIRMPDAAGAAVLRVRNGETAGILAHQRRSKRRACRLYPVLQIARSGMWISPHLSPLPRVVRSTARAPVRTAGVHADAPRTAARTSPLETPRWTGSAAGNGPRPRQFGHRSIPPNQSPVLRFSAVARRWRRTVSGVSSTGSRTACGSQIIPDASGRRIDDRN